jgi:hypothetical protein
MARLRLPMTCLWLAALPLAAAADDPRVPYLEQEVRNLQRQVTSLTRRVDELTTRPARPAPRSAASVAAAATPDASTWLDAGKWRQLRPGMSELETISLLGPPTTMRETVEGRVLFYALEIGTSGFLGGSVTMRKRVVVDVQQPALQ